MHWPDLVVGPEMRFVHVDGCWFDEVGYGGSWRTYGDSELSSENAYETSDPGSASSSLRCSEGTVEMVGDVERRQERASRLV